MIKKQFKIPVKNTAIIVSLVIGISGLLSGCGDNKFQSLSDSKLQEKHSFCENAGGLSPGGAIICDNVYRECKDRAVRKKRKICY